MLPTLDLPTLLLATALAVAVPGLLLTASNRRDLADGAFILWGVAMLLAAGGLAVMATAAAAWPPAGVGGSTLVLLGAAMSWSAARRFAQWGGWFAAVLLGPALYVAIACWPAAPPQAAAIVALAVGAAYSLGAVYALWRSRSTLGRARDAALLLMTVHGCLFLVRALSLLALSVLPRATRAAVLAPAISAALTLEALVHAVAMALLLLAMMKEMSADHALAVARSLALIDGLTGLGNRRCFDEAIHREAARAVREQASLALLMIDADHFKHLNDRLGHPAGDACLVAIGQAIRAALRRAADTVARYGGEEFAVLLPDTAEPGAQAVASAIHAGIAQMALEHPASAHGRMTVSIGLAVLPPGPPAAPAADRPAILLREADSALMAAKSLGRNRTETHRLLQAGTDTAP